MKSPFPGMDPYIEACGLWEDFHGHFVQRIGESLADAVPERYLVRTGERSYVVLVESEGRTSRPILPDVSVTVPRNHDKRAKGAGTAVAKRAGVVKPSPSPCGPSSRKSTVRRSSRFTSPVRSSAS